MPRVKSPRVPTLAMNVKQIATPYDNFAALSNGVAKTFGLGSSHARYADNDFEKAGQGIGQIAGIASGAVGLAQTVGTIGRAIVDPENA